MGAIVKCASRFAMMVLALGACGQSVRTTDGPPTDAGADSTSPPANCAYPIRGEPDPGLLDRVASLTSPGCRYRLGGEGVLPFVHAAPGEPGLAEYAFGYDVNGDEVGDVFFWANRAAPVPHRLELAISVVSNGRIEYVRSECGSLATIPYGRAFVRDLNDDGAPDLVIGPTSFVGYLTESEEPDIAIRVLLNEPSGFVEVLRHAWPEPEGGSTRLLDVAVADFGGGYEGALDVAFGYDRTSGGLVNTVELGVAVIQLDGDPPEGRYRLSSWVDSEERPESLTLGEMALGFDASGPRLFVSENLRVAADPGDSIPGLFVRWQEGSTVESVIQVEAPTPSRSLPGRTYGPYDAWILPLGSVPEALALQYEHDVVFHDLTDLTVAPLPVLLTISTVREHGPDRDFGGGLVSPMRFMVDFDGDGTVDFVERGDHYIAIHRGHANGGFDEPSIVEINANLDAHAESPFVAVGAVRGAILVNGRSGPNSEGSDLGPPTFQQLECATD